MTDAIYMAPMASAAAMAKISTKCKGEAENRPSSMTRPRKLSPSVRNYTLHSHFYSSHSPVSFITISSCFLSPATIRLSSGDHSALATSSSEQSPFFSVLFFLFIHLLSAISFLSILSPHFCYVHLILCFHSIFSLFFSSVHLHLTHFFHSVFSVYSSPLCFLCFHSTSRKQVCLKMMKN